MGSDRARVTFDPMQQYRSVVMQQGRVTLEADWNEAEQIVNEEIRSDSLDFVGPSGTPNNGYLVILRLNPTVPPYDFQIGAGTMYVGGIRASLPGSVRYSQQPDWLDHGSEDAAWVDLSSFTGSPPAPPDNEFVYLYLREQEVSAVEDRDLKDVALGGPDTAQRTRILQRFARIACPGPDCISGLAAAEANWASKGLFFKPDTMRLNSWGTLSVSFSEQSQNPNPCQPQGQGGYLDPDNQLIRVQISGIDPNGNPKFVWGFDNASFLYRINVDQSNPQNLIFQTVPVDASHQPVGGQALEVLKTAGKLPNGGLEAATSGFVFTLAPNSSYIPDSQSVLLPGSLRLPSDYTDPSETQLFLRVWEEEIVFTPGTATPLGNTGILVTLRTSPEQKPFHVGDYWTFAVRPGTPQNVYPERYEKESQAADGPRLWACPLGVIAWNDDWQVGKLAADCRVQFNNLVDLTKRWQGCCTITVRPQDIRAGTTLQSIVNQASSPTMLVQAANPGASGNDITIQISNLGSNSSPPTFDLTVTETNLYLGVSVAGAVNGVSKLLGTGGLAHVKGTVQSQLLPLNNQQIAFAGGDVGANAVAAVMDSANQGAVFTLEARNPGTDGNLTTVTLTNVSGNTFDLAVTWQKTLVGLNMGNLLSNVQSAMSYEITVMPPVTTAPAFPAEGTTQLNGGTDADPTTGTSASTAQAAIFGNPAKICLRPGSYVLQDPLKFGFEQSGITLEACGGAATISAGGPADELINFAQGLIQLNGANDVTLSGITFAMPNIVLQQLSVPPAGQSPTNAAAVAPSITSQPVSRTITAGQTATFSVTATGKAPLNYQWNKNGAAISGATTASYTTPAETTADNGAQFTVVVSNSAGSVTSNAATLTVNATQSFGDIVLFSLNTSVGLMVSGCEGISVENCRFIFPQIQLREIFFGAAIFAGSDCSGINLKENLFQGPAAIKAVTSAPASLTDLALAAGYIQFDSLTSLSTDPSNLIGNVVNGGTLIPSTLDNLVMERNSFENLLLPVFIATALGAAKFERNVVRSCLSGFTILPLVASLATANQLMAAPGARPIQAAALDTRLQILNNTAIQRMMTIALAYPRPDSFVPTRQIVLAPAPAPAPQARILAAVPAQSPARPAAVIRTPTAVTRLQLPPVAAPVPPAGAPGAAAPQKLLQIASTSTARVVDFMTKLTTSGSIGITIGGREGDFNFSVQFSGNDVDAFALGRILGISIPAGISILPALSIVDFAAIIGAAGGSPGTETTLGTLNLTGNRFRSGQPLLSIPTVSVMVLVSAVTGNIILNRDGGASSLGILVPDSTLTKNVAIAAVTGNVFQGGANMPPRAHASPPLPDWIDYNEVV